MRIPARVRALIPPRVRAFVSTFGKEWASDRIGDVAAMMTYYAVFALFPMVIFVVTLGLLILPPEMIDDTVVMAARTMPADVASILSDQVARMQAAAGAGFAIGSALIALWGASRGASALMSALNDLFDKKESRPWWKRQLIAIGTTLLVAGLLVIAMALLAGGPALGQFLVERFGLSTTFETLWGLLRWGLAALLVMLVWAVLYKLLPDTDAPFRIFTPGAVAGVALWFGITQAFAFYLDTFASYEKTYGAVAVVVVFLTWLWLSNLALLAGAEINDVLAELRKDTDPAAAKLAEAEKAPNEKSTPATAGT